MEENQIFVTDYLDLTLLKKYCFFFDKLIFYPRDIQTGGILNKHIWDPNERPVKYIGDDVVRWLFENGIVKIACDSEDLPGILQDKTIVGFNLGLSDFLIENRKKICVKIQLDNADRDIIKFTGEGDNKDKELIGHLQKIKEEIVLRPFWETVRARGLDGPRALPVAKEIVEESLKETKRILSRKIAIGDISHLSEYLVKESKIASMLHSGHLETAYYYKKFNNMNFDSRLIGKIMQGTFELDFFHIDDLNKLDFDSILTVRNTRNWKSAMNQLVELTNNLAIREDTISLNIEDTKQKVHDLIFDSVNEVGFKKSLFATGRKVSKLLIINQFPFLNVTDGLTESAKPLVSYFKKRKKNSLVYFIKDIRQLNLKL